MVRRGIFTMNIKMVSKFVELISSIFSSWLHTSAEKLAYIPVHIDDK